MTTTDEEMRRLAEAALTQFGASGQYVSSREADALVYGARYAARELLDRVAAAEVRAEKAEAEVERLRAAFPCDGGCNYNDGPNQECSLHGYSPRDLWEGIRLKSEQIETLQAEVAALRATVAELTGRNIVSKSKKNSRRYNYKVTEGWPESGTETIAKFMFGHDADLLIEALDEQDKSSPLSARPPRKVKRIKR